MNIQGFCVFLLFLLHQLLLLNGLVHECESRYEA